MCAACSVSRRTVERVGSGSLRDRFQLARRCRRFVGPTGRRLRLREQLEPGRPLGPRAAEEPQVVGGPVRCRRRVTALERDRCLGEHRQRVMLGPGEQRERLVGSPLAPTQLGESRQHVGALARADGSGGDRFAQHHFRLRPLAAQDQHRAVMGAADSAQGADVPVLGHAGDALAPLAGTLEVAHALAGEDQVAAGEADCSPRSDPWSFSFLPYESLFTTAWA